MLKITVHKLKQVFVSQAYRDDLKELSSYAANIKQERPMMLFLSKHLNQQGYPVVLEKNRCDLLVDNIRIESKFHYDFDIPFRLQKEYAKYGGKLDKVWKAAKNRQLSKSWTVIPGIYQDTCRKQTDIFIWIICARDLSGIKEMMPNKLERICMSKWQLAYNGKFGYPSNEFIEQADHFLGELRNYRKFDIEKAVIRTNRDFPTSYHLRICDFRV